MRLPIIIAAIYVPIFCLAIFNVINLPTAAILFVAATLGFLTHMAKYGETDVHEK